MHIENKYAQYPYFVYEYIKSSILSYTTCIGEVLKTAQGFTIKLAQAHADMDKPGDFTDLCGS